MLVNCEQFLLPMKDTHRITHIYRQGRTILNSDRGDTEVIFRMEKREDPEEMVRVLAQI